MTMVKLDGGPYFSFSEGVSLYVDCADQDEVDEYWDKLVKVGGGLTVLGGRGREDMLI